MTEVLLDPVKAEWLVVRADDGTLTFFHEHKDFLSNLNDAKAFAATLTDTEGGK